MFIKEVRVSRREIEAKLASVGDYVKMDYLQAYLKKNLDFDTKKFVMLTLAKIYEERRMFLEAGRLHRAAAEINATYEGKMQDFMRSVELSVKAGDFEDAEISFTKALACSEGMQKERLKARRKQAYLQQAQDMIAKERRKHAAEAYEHYLKIPELSADERKTTQATLLSLYEKLGKMVEYNALKRMMAQPQSALQTQAVSREERKLGSLFRELGL